MADFYDSDGFVGKYLINEALPKIENVIIDALDSKYRCAKDKIGKTILMLMAGDFT